MGDGDPGALRRAIECRSFRAETNASTLVSIPMVLTALIFYLLYVVGSVAFSLAAHLLHGNEN